MYFPIQRNNTQNNQTFRSPQTNRTSEADTIQQLRRENDYLKQQLASLGRVPAHQQPSSIESSSYPNNNNFYQTWAGSRKHEDVEMNFKNKMSRLKSRKSNRKSIERVAQTLPNSPEKRTNNTGFTHPHRYQPSLQIKQFAKFPAAHQQSGGALTFMERRQEEAQRTLRSMAQSPRGHQYNAVPILNFAHLSQQPAHFIPPRPKNHQRRQSAVVSSSDSHQEEFTKRNIGRYHSPVLKEYPQYFCQEPNENHKFLKINFGVSSPSESITPLTHVNKEMSVKENIRPTLTSPRGHAYIQKLEARQNKHQQQDLQMEGDSFLSIQRGLRQQKIDRKLRCDIYLSEGQ